MSHLWYTLACVLVSLSLCQAKNGGLRTGMQRDSTMQPVLVGLSAVVGFLFVVFVILIVKRIFFKKHRTEKETPNNAAGLDNKGLDVETAENVKMTDL